MKEKIQPLLIFTLVMVSLVSCRGFYERVSLTGKGEVVSQGLTLPSFKSLKLEIPAKVILKQGNQQTVIVEGQQNIIDKIVKEVKGEHWDIRFPRKSYLAALKNNQQRNFDDWQDDPHEGYNRYKPVTIYITVPELEKVAVSGSGKLFGESPFTVNESLELRLSGSGKMSLEAHAKSILVSVRGSGKMELKGQSQLMDVKVSGSGRLNASELKSDETSVVVRGSGNAKVHANKQLQVKISGSGDVRYQGEPQLQSKIYGSGSVRQL
ncbi:head GIN domain-containing protein [Xanthovirga aplysinae]|uniref:head GIN domain-containing protein n=1 Tax=Xanthovirga aplysinae TaxID=2529853 RepID=UPI0012BCD468|nr:head GIN domain-containing protein [Xanthovirga aplysinae]MTI30140.1 DUF2807 domain-containing protein [Xanthovirga aplysinae]